MGGMGDCQSLTGKDVGKKQIKKWNSTRHLIHLIKLKLEEENTHLL